MLLPPPLTGQTIVRDRFFNPHGSLSNCFIFISQKVFYFWFFYLFFCCQANLFSIVSFFLLVFKNILLLFSFASSCVLFVFKASPSGKQLPLPPRCRRSVAAINIRGLVSSIVSLFSLTLTSRNFTGSSSRQSVSFRLVGHTRASQSPRPQ